MTMKTLVQAEDLMPEHVQVHTQAIVCHGEANVSVYHFCFQADQRGVRAGWRYLMALLNRFCNTLST